MEKNYKREASECWKQQVLRAVRNQKRLSRPALCQELGVSITTVNRVIQEMSEEGLITETGAGASTGGRKPGLISLSEDGAFFLGIEFSAFGLSCVVLNFNFDVIYRKTCRFAGNESGDYLLNCIVQELKAAEFSLSDRKNKICGIGIGAPGYLDHDTGTLVFYSQNTQWSNYPIMAGIKKEFSYPLYLRNNINVMSFGYKWVYCGGICEDHVIVANRYGLKIAAFSNNHQIEGAHGFIGEIGHMHANGSNRLCRCGKRGCFDTEVTYAAIGMKIDEGIHVGHFQYLKEKIRANGGYDIQLFTDACNEGDEESIALMTETVISIAAALAWTCYMLDPAVILVHSKLDEYRDFYPLLRDVMYRRYENNFTYGKINIQPAPYGEQLGAIGAAAYVYEQKYGRLL